MLWTSAESFPTAPTIGAMLTLLCVLLCGAPLVRAQSDAAPTPEASTGAAAAPSEYDALVLRALAAYDAGRWDEARRLFERAHALDPTARTLRTIGMSAYNQGDWLAALSYLEAALVDTRKPLTDEQRTHALGLIERANRQVGRYRVRLRPAGATLLVDGAPPALITQDELALLPGQHVVRVTALGYQPLERALEVRGGDRDQLELTLSAEGAPVAAGAPAAPASVPAEVSGTTSMSTPRRDVGGSNTTLGVIAVSVGGAALVASGVTLAFALSDKSELDDACPGRSCPPDVEDTRSRYQTLRIVSPVALCVGVVSVAVGLVVLVTGGDEDAADRAQLLPSVGPRTFVLRGTL